MFRFQNSNWILPAAYWLTDINSLQLTLCVSFASRHTQTVLKGQYEEIFCLFIHDTKLFCPHTPEYCTYCTAISSKSSFTLFSALILTQNAHDTVSLNRYCSGSGSTDKWLSTIAPLYIQYMIAGLGTHWSVTIISWPAFVWRDQRQESWEICFTAHIHRHLLRDRRRVTTCLPSLLGDEDIWCEIVSGEKNFFFVLGRLEQWRKDNVQTQQQTNQGRIPFMYSLSSQRP